MSGSTRRLNSLSPKNEIPLPPARGGRGQGEGRRATASEPAVGHLPDAIIAEAHHNVLRLRHDQLQPTEMTVLPVTSSGGFRMTLGSQFLVRELTLGPDVSIDVSVRSPSASGRPRCPASLVFVLTWPCCTDRSFGGEGWRV